MITFGLGQLFSIGGVLPTTTCTDEFCLTVSLRILFATGAELASEWGADIDGHPVYDATVSFAGITAQTTEASGGDAFFHFDPLAEGVVKRSITTMMRVEPASTQRSRSAAGPGSASELSLSNQDTTGSPRWRDRAMLFRPFDLFVRMEITSSGAVFASVRARTPSLHFRFEVRGDRTLLVDWRPDFIQSVRFSPRGDVPIQYIVVHRTGSDDIGSTLEGFTANHGPPTDNPSVHYLVNQDGFVVKMVQDISVAFHVSFTYWKGDTAVKEGSIGIEIVGAPGTDLPQYEAVNDLIASLRSQHGVGRHNVVAHSSVLVAQGTFRTANTGCPEANFRWPQIEQSGLVTLPLRGAALRDPLIPTPWDSAVIAAFPDYLTTGSPPVLRAVPDQLKRSVAIVMQMQAHLVQIGYPVGPDQNGTSIDGGWGAEIQQAIKAFKRRFVVDPDDPGTAGEFGSIDFTLAAARAMFSVLDDIQRP